MTEELTDQLKKLFEEAKCIQCTKHYWRRKDEGAKSDVCEECRGKNIKNLVETNPENI